MIFVRYAWNVQVFVQLGTIGIGRTIFWANHAISSITGVEWHLQCWITATGVLSFRKHTGLISSSNHIMQNGSWRSFIQHTKEHLFLNKRLTTGIKCVGWVCSLTTITTDAGQLYEPLLSWFLPQCVDSCTWVERWSGCVTTTSILFLTLSNYHIHGVQENCDDCFWQAQTFDRPKLCELYP